MKNCSGKACVECKERRVCRKYLAAVGAAKAFALLTLCFVSMFVFSKVVAIEYPEIIGFVVPYIVYSVFANSGRNSW